jgi:hypothetical protein
MIDAQGQDKQETQEYVAKMINRTMDIPEFELQPEQVREPALELQPLE